MPAAAHSLVADLQAFASVSRAAPARREDPERAVRQPRQPRAVHAAEKGGMAAEPVPEKALPALVAETGGGPLAEGFMLFDRATRRYATPEERWASELARQKTPTQLVWLAAQRRVEGPARISQPPLGFCFSTRMWRQCARGGAKRHARLINPTRATDELEAARRREQRHRRRRRREWRQAARTRQVLRITLTAL